MGNRLANMKRIEADLWEAADNLRANSKLTSTEYCMPVLGVIFLRHAANRFDAVTKEIAASGKKRKPVKADYVKRRSLFLPEESRYDYLLGLSTDVDLGEAVITAMEKIEESFEPLAGVLPKEFTIFDRDVLEDLLRVFDSEAMKSASGDVFGRIYEYFLMKFAMQGAQDNAGGLKDEEQYLFELLQRDDLKKTELEKLKEGSRQLLDALKELIEPMHDWWEKEQTRAEVEVEILDKVYDVIPMPPYGEVEAEEFASQIFNYIFERSEAGSFPGTVA